MIDFQGKATLSKLPTSVLGTDRFSGEGNSISCLHHYGEMIDFQGKATLSKLPTSLWGTDRFPGEGNSIKVVFAPF